jgi:hypothetical protein
MKSNKFIFISRIILIFFALVTSYAQNSQTYPIPLPPIYNSQPPITFPEEELKQPEQLPQPTPTLIDFDNKINERPLWASACYANDENKYECQMMNNPFIDFARQPLSVIANDILNNKIPDLNYQVLKNKIADYVIKNFSKIDQINNEKISFNHQVGNDNFQNNGSIKKCYIIINENDNISTNCELDLTVIVNGGLSANFNKTFIKADKVNNNATDNIIGKYIANFSSKHILDLKLIKNESGEIVYDEEGTSLFYVNDPYYYNGKVENLMFKFDLANTQNNDIIDGRFAELLTQFTSSTGLRIIKSTWQNISRGFLEGIISGSWGLANYDHRKYRINLDKFEFCPNKCEISIEENLNVEAEKIITANDRRQGPIKIKQRHFEKFVGNGKTNLKTGSIFWQNVTINKQDERQWDRKIDYVMPNGEKYRWSYYSGNIFSVARLKPNDNFNFVSTKAYKDLLFDQVLPISQPSDNISYLKTTKQAILDKYEERTNENISRQGNGIVQISSPGSSRSISGIYDNLSPLMKVTSPKEMANQRIDPIEYTNPQERVYDISSVLGPGGYYVPGFFTVTYGNPTTTVVTSKPIKLLPKTIVVFWSFKEGDLTFSPIVKIKINNFIDWLKSRGVNVIQFRTNSREKFLNAFKQIPNGSWLFNIGHGYLTGLSAGGDFIPYYELKSIIEQNNIRIDTFSGITCFSGRSPLGEKVIGSLGVMLNDPINLSGLGRIIGFGNNPWNLTIADLFNIFCYR